MCKESVKKQEAAGIPVARAAVFLWFLRIAQMRPHDRAGLKCAILTRPVPAPCGGACAPLPSSLPREPPAASGLGQLLLPHVAYYD